MMNQNDRDAAEKALMNWFQSQRLEPGEAVIIMSHVIARCVWALARDADAYQHGLDIVADMVRTTEMHAGDTN